MNAALELVVLSLKPVGDLFYYFYFLCNVIYILSYKHCNERTPYILQFSLRHSICPSSFQWTRRKTAVTLSVACQSLEDA